MRARNVREMVAESIRGKTGDPPWHWVSFASGDLPVGQQFLGVAIVRAWNVGHASQVCWEHGCNPGGSVMAMPIPEQFGAPPDVWNHKLIRDKAEVERLTREWHGCGLLQGDGEEFHDPNEPAPARRLRK